MGSLPNSLDLSLHIQLVLSQINTQLSASSLATTEGYISVLVRQNAPTQPRPWPQDICSSRGSQNIAQ